MTSPEAGTRWARSEDVAFVADGERVAGIDLTHLDAPPFILEGSAAFLWGELEGLTASELCQRAAVQFAVEEDDVAGQVLDFLRRLEQQGLAHRR